MQTATGTLNWLGIEFDFECDYDEDGPQELFIRMKGTPDFIEAALGEVSQRELDIIDAAITNEQAFAGDRAYDAYKEAL